MVELKITLRQGMRTAQIAVHLGDDVSEKALKGFVQTYGKLLAEGAKVAPERFDDFMKYFTHSNGTINKSALKQTLEGAVDDFALNPDKPKIFLRGIEQVHPTTYRYIDDV